MFEIILTIYLHTRERSCAIPNEYHSRIHTNAVIHQNVVIKKKTKKNSLFFRAYNAKSIKSCAGSQLLYPLRVVWTDSTPHSSNKQNHEIFSLHDNFDDSVCSAICTAPAISPTPPPCDDMPGYMYIVQRTVVQSM